MDSIVHPDPRKRRSTDNESKYQWVIDGLKQLGIPVVFSAVLLWFVLTIVKDNLTDLNRGMLNHISVQERQDRAVNDNAVVVKELLLSIERINQRVCFNTAKTNAERYECYK